MVTDYFFAGDLISLNALKQNLRLETEIALLRHTAENPQQINTTTTLKKNPKNQHKTPIQNRSTMTSVYVNTNSLVFGIQDIWKMGICTEHAIL